jgi:hypothetical protein
MPAVDSDHTMACTMPIFNMNAQNGGFYSNNAPTNVETGAEASTEQAVRLPTSFSHHASPFKPNVARGDSILFCTNTRLTPPPLRPPTYLTRFALPPSPPLPSTPSPVRVYVAVAVLPDHHVSSLLLPPWPRSPSSFSFILVLILMITHTRPPCDTNRHSETSAPAPVILRHRW